MYHVIEDRHSCSDRRSLSTTRATTTLLSLFLPAMPALRLSFAHLLAYLLKASDARRFLLANILQLPCVWITPSMLRTLLDYSKLGMYKLCGVCTWTMFC